MSVTILSCEDDSDPPDEQPHSLVSPAEDGKSIFPLLPHSILTLLRKVKVKASPKSKTRPGRGSLRSLISIHAFRDDRYLLRRLAVLCKNTTPLLGHYPLSKHLLPNDEVMGIGVISHPQAQAPIPSIRRITPVSDPVTAAIAKQSLQYPHIASEEKALNSSFCIPTILITPPSDNDNATYLGCNVIPMPQNSADGVYLTVPDVDPSHAWYSYEGRYTASQTLERCMELGDHATRSHSGAEMESGIKELVKNYACFQEEIDDDETIDLGPTWSG